MGTQNRQLKGAVTHPIPDYRYPVGYPSWDRADSVGVVKGSHGDESSSLCAQIQGEGFESVSLKATAAGGQP